MTPWGCHGRSGLVMIGAVLLQACRSNAVTPRTNESPAPLEAGDDDAPDAGDGAEREAEAGACAPAVGDDVPDELRPIEGELQLPLPPRDEAPFEVTADQDGFRSYPWRSQSADGQLALLQVMTQDENGQIGLSVEIRKVDSDTRVKRVVVTHPGECKKIAPSACDQLIKARLRPINAILAKQKWTGSVTYSPSPSEVVEHMNCDDPRITQRLRLPKLDIQFNPPRLRVLRADGRPIIDRSYHEWMPKNLRLPDCEALNRPYLNDISVDIERRVLSFSVFYCGGDTCEELPSHFHLYRLPKL